MTYKWIDGHHTPQTFDGFQRYAPIDHGKGQIVAVAHADGEVDLWELANDGEAVSELARFYRATIGYVPGLNLFKAL